MTTNYGADATLLLITADPAHPLAHLALRYARTYLAHSHLARSHLDSVATQDTSIASMRLKLFFYADGAHIANRLRWQSADQLNLTKEWQALAERYQLRLPVCVSTALSRGITDSENSARHNLDGNNLASGFELVGLSELAMMMNGDCRLIQF